MGERSFLLGVMAGLAIGWFLWTETGQMLLGASKEMIKARLREKLEELERS